MVNEEEHILATGDMFEYYMRLYQSGLLPGQRRQITRAWMSMNGLTGFRFKAERDRVRLAVKRKLNIYIGGS